LRTKLARRRGAVILITASLILTLTVSIALVYVRFALNEYRSVTTAALREKSLQLAQSGLETGILLLTRIGTDQLYEFGIFAMAPTIPLGGGMVTLSITEESGKLNMNRLVNFFEDQANLHHKGYFQRLSLALGVSPDLWDAVIDYIDENNTPMARGAERDAYESLVPPRRIKNGRMQSVEELLFIPGFDPKMMYEDLRSLDKRKNQKAGLSEVENVIVTEADYILANNLTTYLPIGAETGVDKININSAPYHVILSLSEFMTPVIARKILTERLKRNGRLKDIVTLQNAVPELKMNTTGAATLYQEIENSITTQDQLYKIVADASIDSQSAQVMGVLDVNAKKLVFYSE